MKRFVRSASAAAVWLVCGGSLKLSKGLLFGDDDRSSSEGTAAHNLAAAMLKGSPQPASVRLCHKCGSDGVNDRSCPKCGSRDIIDDGEMPLYVGHYVDYCRQLIDDNVVAHRGIEVEVESAIHVDFGGHADFYLVYNDSTGRTWLHVVDLKNGIGVPVRSELNRQVLSYLLLLRERHPNIRHFRGTVHQPRVGDGLPYTVEYSKAEIDEFEAEVTLSPFNEDLVPGSHCRFCNAASDCPVAVEFPVAMVAAEDRPARNAEDQYELWRQFMLVAPAIRRLLSTIPRRMLRAMREGVKFEGFKPVATTARRQWDGSENYVMLELVMRGVPMSETTTYKLLSPAQLEKLGYAEEIADLVFRPDGGIVIVPEDDRRQAVDVTPLELEAWTGDVDLGFEDDE